MEIITAKTAELIEMPFGSDGPTSPCITWGAGSPWRRGNFAGGQTWDATGMPAVGFQRVMDLCDDDAAFYQITLGKYL